MKVHMYVFHTNVTRGMFIAFFLLCFGVNIRGLHHTYWSPQDKIYELLQDSQQEREKLIQEKEERKISMPIGFAGEELLQELYCEQLLFLAYKIEKKHHSMQIRRMTPEGYDRANKKLQDLKAKQQHVLKKLCKV